MPVLRSGGGTSGDSSDDTTLSVDELRRRQREKQERAQEQQQVDQKDQQTDAAVSAVTTGTGPSVVQDAAAAVSPSAPLDKQQDFSPTTVDADTSNLTRGEKQTDTSAPTSSISRTRSDPTGADDKSKSGGQGFFEGVASGVVNTAETVKGTGEATFDIAKGTGEATFNLATGKENLGDVSEGATNEFVEKASGAGQTIFAAATGGNAKEARENFWQNTDADKSKFVDPAKKQIQEGDLLGTIGATGSAGFEYSLDNPGGSVQDTTRGALVDVTGAKSGKSLAKNIAQTYTGVESTIGEVPRQALKGTALDNPATDAVASFSGGAFKAFVQDPAEGLFSAATGIDPRATKGETEKRVDTAKVADALFTVGTLGTGKAATAGVKALSKSDELLSASDEAASATSAADETGSAFGLFEDATTATDEAAAAADDAPPGAARFGTADEAAAAADTTASMGLFGTLGSVVSKSDEIARAADEATAATDDAISEVDETVTGLPARPQDVVGLGSMSDEGASTFDEFASLDTGVSASDDALTGTRTVFEETVPSVDETLSSARGATSSLSDEISATIDEATRSATGTVDEGASVVDEGRAGFDNLFSSVRGTVDEATSAASRAGGRATGFLSTSDEAAAGSDEAGSAFGMFDDAATGADDSLSLSDESLAASDETASLADETAAGSDEAADSLFSSRKAQAGLLGGGVLGGTLLGGLLAGGGGSGDGGGGSGGGDSSSVWSGQIDAPAKIGQNQSATVNVEVRNTTSQRHASSFVLGVLIDGQIGKITEARKALGGNSSTQFQMTIPEGTLSIQQGSYEMVLVATGDGQGRVAKQSFEVVAPGEGDASKSAWGQAELVKKLPAGWYLFRQQKKDGSDERFLIAGKRKDGTRIYMMKGGNVRSGKPYFFKSMEKAVSAFRAWMRRQRNGNTNPSERPGAGGGRPSPEGVTKDAAKGAAGRSGLISSAVQATEENPLLAAGAALIVGSVGYYYYKHGELPNYNEFKKMLKGWVNQVEKAVGGGS